MIGGTSRGEDDDALLVVVVLDGTEAGGEEGEEVDGVLGIVVLVSLVESGEEEDSVEVLVLVASRLRDMPSRLSISSLRRPLDSRKETLRSMEASRMESSCRNLVACSRRDDREVLVWSSSEAGDGVELELVSGSLGAEALGFCQSGIEARLGLGSDIMFEDL